MMLASIGAAQPSPSPASPPPASPRYIHVAPAESLAVFGAMTAGPASATSSSGVVLLPGTLGSAFALRHLTRTLEATGVRVLVLDPLGMGASGRPLAADYSLEAQARRVVQVLDSLGWQRVVVAGQGTSATIALRVASRAPARVLGVVSIAGGPVATQGTDGVRTALRFARLLDTPPGRALARRHFARELHARAVRHDWITPDVERAYVGSLLVDLPSALRVLQRMQGAHESVPLEDALRRVRAPVQVFVGRERRPGAPSAEQLALLVRLVPQARVDSVGGTGVLLHEETPEVITRGILALLARAVTASTR
jgi:pimeloyl-ACP methyl ester carboxylesterase